jgi:hypothetical protein
MLGHPSGQHAGLGAHACFPAQQVFGSPLPWASAAMAGHPAQPDFSPAARAQPPEPWAEAPAAHAATVCSEFGALASGSASCMNMNMTRATQPRATAMPLITRVRRLTSSLLGLSLACRNLFDLNIIIHLQVRDSNANRPGVNVWPKERRREAAGKRLTSSSPCVICLGAN